MTNAFGYFPSMRRLVTRSSAEQCPVIKIVVTRDARVDNESRDSPEGGVKLDSFNIIYCIDYLHNGDRFKYSFMCILISLLGLIQVQRFYSITDTETRPRRLIKMHIKEYLNRSPLCK